MGVPRQRLTKSRRNRRRANIFLESTNLIKCEKCGKEKKPHIVCLNCGFYKGIEVVNVLEKLDKKERKQREKELKEGGEKKTEKEKK
jgi:large subunit ribosomal protein L32